MVDLLVEHELLFLLVVVMVGLWVSRVEIRGFKLGIAGVLFVGLGLAAWVSSTGRTVTLSPDLKEFGLILFVYCVGLSSGSGFFAAFRERGVKLNIALLLALVAGGIVAVLGGELLGLRRGLIAGVFCGSLTNTPALGAATDALRGTPQAVDPVLGYSVTYPFGVLGALIAFRIFLKVNKEAVERERQEAAPQSRAELTSRVCVVERQEVIHHSIGELEVRSKLGVIVSRLQRGDEQVVPTKYTVLHAGDLLILVGTRRAVEEAILYFGKESALLIQEDRSQIDMRRILVSKKEIAGKKIVDLALDRTFGAQITRVRRADLDIIPSPDFRIEQGDRLRVVAPRDRLKDISVFFGDSERELAAIDFVAVSLGITAGILVGLIPFSLFGATLSLGAAGGPLLVALVLGRLGRTGPFNWTLPFEVNHALRDLGLFLFLAAVGIGAGSAFGKIGGYEGLALLGLGMAVTLTSAFVTMLLGRRLAKASIVTSLGITSGMQTQPATLADAYELSGKSEETYVAYALGYPVAMIAKIVLAQVIAMAS